MIRSVRRADTGLPETSIDILPRGFVYLEKPTSEEIEEVGEAYKLNVDTLKDALDPFEAPRFEVEGDIAYLFLRYPDTSESETTTTPLLIAISPIGLVMVCTEKPPFIDKFINGDIVFDTSKPVSVLLQIQSNVDALYSQALTKIQRAVNHKKRGINKITENDIVEFASHEMALNDYMDALVPQNAVLLKLASKKVFDLDKKESDTVEDLILSANQHTELSKSLLKTTEDIRSAYMAISTERLNQVLKRLTALTLIIALPTLITSFFGMNVPLPFQDQPDAVIGITVTIVVIAIIMLVVFSKRRWY